MTIPQMAKEFKDKTAICGVGLTIGSFPDKTPLSLAVDAYQKALDDAGLKRGDVDGIIQLAYGSDYDRFLEAVGTDVRYANQGWTHGRFIAPCCSKRPWSWPVAWQKPWQWYMVEKVGNLANLPIMKCGAKV